MQFEDFSFSGTVAPPASAAQGTSQGRLQYLLDGIAGADADED